MLLQPILPAESFDPKFALPGFVEFASHDQVRFNWIREMKVSATSLALCVWVAMTLAAASGQSAADGAGKPNANIVGTVVKDPNGEPAKKVVIELISDEHSHGANYTAVSGADGTFQIEGIRPGQYRLFVEKTGFLEVEKTHPRPEGRLLALTAGQEMKDIVVHLLPAAIAHGRVTDEDGDPMAGAQVGLLRQTYQSGRRQWETAGTETTNDLGEYRIAGIAPGTYYVAVSPPPNFRAMVEASGTAGSPRAPERQRMSYRTTYYPAALEPDQATPVTFHAGDEFPMDFSLAPQPSFAVRGIVAGIPPNASAVVMLQSGDLGEVFNGAETHKDGSFEMPDVAPGDYALIASVAGNQERLMTKQRVHISSAPVEGLRLSLQPGSVVRGRLSLNASPGKTAVLNQFSVLLVGDDGENEGTRAMILGEGFSSVASVQADGSFEWKDVAPGHYYPQLISGSFTGSEWFLRSGSAGGRDLSDSGFTVGGSPLVMDLVASSRSASVTGIAKNHDGKPVANATIVAVPALRYRKRPDHYTTGTSDQTGHFTLQGVRPGDYTLFAWESLDGEQYFDPDFVKRSEGQGSAMKLAESERKTIELEVVPAENQP